MTILGLDEALAAFEKLGAAGRRECARAVAATTAKIHRDAIDSIQHGQKSGVTYKRGSGQNLSATHKASAPGEAPATDSGGLVNSLKADFSGLSGKVFSKMPRSFWLEYGTTKIAPRPFLIPAARANEQFFIDQIAQGLVKASAEFNK